MADEILKNKIKTLFFLFFCFTYGAGLPLAQAASHDVRVFLDISKSDDDKKVAERYEQLFDPSLQKTLKSKNTQWGLALFASQLNFIWPVQHRAWDQKSLHAVLQGVKPWGKTGDWVHALEKGTFYQDKGAKKSVWLLIWGQAKAHDAAWKARVERLLHRLKANHVVVHVRGLQSLSSHPEWHWLKELVHQTGGDWHVLGVAAPVPQERFKTSMKSVNHESSTGSKRDLPGEADQASPTKATGPTPTSTPQPAPAPVPALAAIAPTPVAPPPIVKTLDVVPTGTDGDYSFKVSMEGQDMVIAIEKVIDPQMSSSPQLIAPDGKRYQASDPALQDPKSPIQWRQIGSHDVISITGAQKGRWAIQGAGINVSTVSVHSNVKWRIDHMPAAGQANQPFDLKVHMESGTDQITNPDILKLWQGKATFEQEGKSSGEEIPLQVNPEGGLVGSGRFPAVPGQYGLKLSLSQAGRPPEKVDAPRVEVRAVEPEKTPLSPQKMQPGESGSSPEVHAPNQKKADPHDQSQTPPASPPELAKGAEGTDVSKTPAETAKGQPQKEPTHETVASEKATPQSSHSMVGTQAKQSAHTVSALKTEGQGEKAAALPMPMIYRLLIVAIIWGILIAGGWYGWKWWQKRNQKDFAEAHGVVEPSIGEGENGNDSGGGL